MKATGFELTPEEQAIMDGEQGEILQKVMNTIVSYGKLMGATRPSVGRELKKFAQEGSIDIQYGKLIIRDFATFGEQYDHLLSVEPVVPDYD